MFLELSRVTCQVRSSKKKMGLPLMMERSSNNNNVELSRVAVSDTHGEDSPYFAGWKAYDENPYDESHNPSGVIQMGLAENQVIKSFI